MSCRRADLASNELRSSARNTRTRRTIVNTIRAVAAQSLGGEINEDFAEGKAHPFEIAERGAMISEGKDLRKAPQFGRFMGRRRFC
jgi:hypothetical protein